TGNPVRVNDGEARKVNDPRRGLLTRCGAIGRAVSVSVRAQPLRSQRPWTEDTKAPRPSNASPGARGLQPPRRPAAPTRAGATAPLVAARDTSRTDDQHWQIVGGPNLDDLECVVTAPDPITWSPVRDA